MKWNDLFSANKEPSLFGRYITLKDIEPLLRTLNANLNLEIAGHSVQGKPIYNCTIGTGAVRILMWSQMHGNESTTTKALFDFLNFLNSDALLAENFLDYFTICLLPMLNPDGAALYTRENANKVDLNRDSVQLSQPESQILRNVFQDFKPDYCFNLHDQRTIFGLEHSDKPATVSFLAPAYNAEKEYNEVRTKAVNIIVAMNDALQHSIPNQVGRFDDTFNNNCIGDMFQSLQVPTILIEAGHFQDDYDREITREMLFIALISGLQYIYENDVVADNLIKYLQIPQNKVVFYDIFYKNVKINYDNKEIITNFALQFKEEIVAGKVHFVAYVSKIGDLTRFLAHYEYDAQNKLYSNTANHVPKLNEKANFSLDNELHFVNGLKKV